MSQQQGRVSDQAHEGATHGLTGMPHEGAIKEIDRSTRHCLPVSVLVISGACYLRTCRCCCIHHPDFVQTSTHQITITMQTGNRWELLAWTTSPILTRHLAAEILRNDAMTPNCNWLECMLIYPLLEQQPIMLASVQGTRHAAARLGIEAEIAASEDCQGCQASSHPDLGELWRPPARLHGPSDRCLHQLGP